MTTVPEPIIAHAPMSTPVTTIAPAPSAAPLPNDRATEFPVVRRLEPAVGCHGPRNTVVGEDDVRPDEDAVVEDDPFVQRGVVLHLDPVADDDAQVDEAVATEDALLADSSSGTDLHVGPDLGSLADHDVVVDLCRRVYPYRRHVLALVRWCGPDYCVRREPTGSMCQAVGDAGRWTG